VLTIHYALTADTTEFAVSKTGHDYGAIYGLSCLKLCLARDAGEQVFIVAGSNWIHLDDTLTRAYFSESFGIYEMFVGGKASGVER